MGSSACNFCLWLRPRLRFRLLWRQPERKCSNSGKLTGTQQEHSMPPRPSFRQTLNRAVAEQRLLVIPGGYDALSALLIERTGFDCMFVGGFPGARYGVPDVGLAGFADIASAVRDIIAACDVPVLVDIDDGYGDVKNAVHTVQSYERMGASAVFLEDQAWPKRCGHMAGKKVVPAEVMEAKIRATMAERLDAETLICVRTDARAVLASAASGQRGHAIKCARRTLALKRARRRAPLASAASGQRGHAIKCARRTLALKRARRRAPCSASTRRCGAPSATFGPARKRSSSRRRRAWRSSSG